MTSRDRQICEKILSEAAIIGDMLNGVSFEDFQCDERTYRAVCMTLINIGELVKNLTDAMKSAYPQIPWRAISGMRDITAHKYQTLRKEDVYDTCIKDIPAFEQQLSEILSGDA